MAPFKSRLLQSGMLLLIIGSLICLCLCGCYHVVEQTFQPNITVAQDGSGHFRTIEEAIHAAPNNNELRFYIKIKAGVYRETIRVGDEKSRLTLIGDGMNKTLIVGNRSNRGGFATYDTATAGIKDFHFVAIDITFENDAGPENMQAVALSSDVESAFFRCSFLGYQDTLYAKNGRQFYRDCHIYGTVDFIFGDATVVFQKCIIFVRKPLKQQYNTITAQGREQEDGLGGTVLQNCYINASSDFEKYQSMFKTYIGRPWKAYSRVVVLQSYINDLVDPKGWVAWDNNTQTDKLYFAEYQNRGVGAATSGRVNWSTILNTSKEAAPFTVRNFIQGHTWIPMGIPFNPDLF